MIGVLRDSRSTNGGREYLHPDDDGECRVIVKWVAGKRFYCARAEVRLGVGSCVTRVAGPNDIAQLYAKQCSAQLSVLDRRDRGVRWPPRLVATAENRLTESFVHETRILVQNIACVSKKLHAVLKMNMGISLIGSVLDDIFKKQRSSNGRCSDIICDAGGIWARCVIYHPRHSARIQRL